MKARDPNDCIKNKELINLWLDDSLANIFPLQSALYSENEVENLIRQYQHSAHPQSNEIVVLLQKLSSVLSATTTNSFKQFRDVCNVANIHPMLQKALQEMTLELQKFNQLSITENVETDSQAINVLTSAETYCKKALQKRLNELSVLNDPIANLNEISILETLLNNAQSPSLKLR